MTWAVCIVGKVETAERVLDERFAEARARAVSTGNQQEVQVCDLLKSAVSVELEHCKSIAEGKYISITAAADFGPDAVEAKLAVRLLPGFVE